MSIWPFCGMARLRSLWPTTTSGAYLTFWIMVVAAILVEGITTWWLTPPLFSLTLLRSRCCLRLVHAPNMLTCSRSDRLTLQRNASLITLVTKKQPRNVESPKGYLNEWFYLSSFMVLQRASYNHYGDNTAWIHVIVFYVWNNYSEMKTSKFNLECFSHAYKIICIYDSHSHIYFSFE